MTTSRNSKQQEAWRFLWRSPYAQSQCIISLVLRDSSGSGSNEGDRGVPGPIAWPCRVAAKRPMAFADRDSWAWEQGSAATAGPGRTSARHRQTAEVQSGGLYAGKVEVILVNRRCRSSHPSRPHGPEPQPFETAGEAESSSLAGEPYITGLRDCNKGIHPQTQTCGRSRTWTLRGYACGEALSPSRHCSEARRGPGLGKRTQSQRRTCIHVLQALAETRRKKRHRGTRRQLLGSGERAWQTT